MTLPKDKHYSQNEPEIWLPGSDIIQFVIAVKDGLFEPNKTGLKKYIKLSKSILSHKKK